MDSLLRYAFVRQRCNVCAHSYAVTLQETLMEQRTFSDWQSPRHCARCRQEASPLTSVVPRELLEQLQRTWDEVAGMAESAGFQLETGDPEAVR